MNKKNIITAALGVMILTGTALPNSAVHAVANTTATTSTSIKTFTVHGKDSTARIVKGYVTVPLKDLASILGWKITLKSKGTYQLTKGKEVITLKVNEARVQQGQQATVLPVPVRLVNQRLYVPVRAMTQLLGAEILWNAGTQTISIINKNSVTASGTRYTFTKDAEGWTSGFADLPVDHAQADYQLRSGQGLIPLQAGTKTNGFMLSGMNRSDDLFMFMTRALGTTEGVKPNTEYKVRLSFDLATNEGTQQFGIGGSPGQSVFVKAGILNTAPTTVKESSTGTPYYRMSLDKGNQSTDGKDMMLLGNIEKTTDAEGYALKHFEQEFKVKSNAAGKLYVIIGTDSGYEGLSTLYFTNIEIKLGK